MQLTITLNYLVGIKNALSKKFKKQKIKKYNKLKCFVLMFSREFLPVLSHLVIVIANIY